jgi:hypothetical protein
VDPVLALLEHTFNTAPGLKRQIDLIDLRTRDWTPQHRIERIRSQIEVGIGPGRADQAWIAAVNHARAYHN